MEKSSFTSEMTQKIIEYIRKNPIEMYWDYRDRFSIEQRQRILQSEDGFDELEQEIFENSSEYIWELQEQFTEQIAQEFFPEEEINKDLLEEIEKTFQEEYIIDPKMEEIIRKDDDIFFYDTGISITPDKEGLEKLIKVVGEEHENKAKELINDLFYEGSLCIAFKANVLDFRETEEYKFIHFRNAHLVIPDHSQGSGWDVSFPGLTLTLPFIKGNLYLDCAVKYSYTDDVCGLDWNWCEDTEFDLFKRTTTIVTPIGESFIQEYLEREEKLNETFRNGGCTPGDMRYDRHRDIYYLNEFPCGSHCPHCGTFWID